MASLFTKNLFFASKINFSKVAPRNFNFTKSTLISSKPLTLGYSRNFADSVNKDHFKGLPEQHEWKTEHLETYLRNFASRHNIKQNDVDHLIKTFVTGPTAAADFFKLDKESMAAKIGKETADRTNMANLLVGDMWKETAATAKRMMDYGSLFVVAAAGVFGVWAYNHYYSGDAKKDMKNAKDSAKSAMHDAKDSAKSMAHDAKDAGRSMAHDAKDAGRSMANDARNAKDSAKSMAHDAKDSAKSAMHDAANQAKDSANNAKNSAKSAMHDAKDSANNAKDSAKSTMDKAKNSASTMAHDAKDAMVNGAQHAKDSMKSMAHDAKDAAKHAVDDVKRKVSDKDKY